MKVPEYYMTLLQELSEGTRKPPEGISLSQQEPLPRAIELIAAGRVQVKDGKAYIREEDK